MARLCWLRAGRHLTLLVMLVVVAFVMFLVVERVFLGQDHASLAEEYPLPSEPELPFTNVKDEALLRSAWEEFLDNQEWNEANTIPGHWEFGDIGTLTWGGARVGVYGDIVFPARISLSGPTVFVNCGFPETWEQEKWLPLEVEGFRISMLDGKHTLYQVVPLDFYQATPVSKEFHR